MARPARPPITQLGEEIRRRRGATPLTEMAHALGVSHPHLSRVEHGKSAPGLGLVLVLARWLGWSPERGAEAARARVVG